MIRRIKPSRAIGWSSAIRMHSGLTTLFDTCIDCSGGRLYSASKKFAIGEDLNACRPFDDYGAQTMNAWDRKIIPDPISDTRLGYRAIGKLPSVFVEVPKIFAAFLQLRVFRSWH